MRHKKTALAGALVILMAGAAGCGMFTPTSSPVDPPPTDANKMTDKQTNMMSSTLYFADEKGFVVPLRVNIPKAEGVLNQALTYLTPEKSEPLLTGTGLHSVIPKGTKMTVNLKDNMAIVDFNNEILKIKDPKAEQQLVDAVIWTLTEQPNIKQVQLTVNGSTISALPASLTPIGQPLSRSNGINLQVAPNINPMETTRVTLYYQRTNSAGNFSYLVPVTRVIAKTTEDPVKTTIAQLAAGPINPDLKTTLSPSSKLLEAKTLGDTVTLDFDNLLTEGATTEQNKLFNSIILSVLENSAVQKVKITVKGQTPNAAGMDLSKPMLRPQTINQKPL